MQIQPSIFLPSAPNRASYIHLHILGTFYSIDTETISDEILLYFVRVRLLKMFVERSSRNRLNCVFRINLS